MGTQTRTSENVIGIAQQFISARYWVVLHANIC